MESKIVHTNNEDLIHWISNLSDESVLMQLLKIKKSSESDWWNALSEIEKNKVVIDLKDSVEGSLVANEVVMDKYGIYWTVNAINDLDNNLEYLQSNWSYKEVESFK